MKPTFKIKFQEKKLIAVFHFFFSVIGCPMANFGHYPGHNLNHPMVITALLSIFHVKVTESIVTSLFLGTTHTIKSQNLKSSRDLGKNCLNSRQHFLIIQRQKKNTCSEKMDALSNSKATILC